jgi:thiol-disulfide isomerase/thioredoxin
VQDAKSALVVVDFFKTSCGACKYIQPGFVKLCKATHEEFPEILFVKHNVYDDEEEETTDLSRRLAIKVCSASVAKACPAFLLGCLLLNCNRSCDIRYRRLQ